MITAKPIIENKYWILKENDQKVGTVEQVRNGYIVKLNDDHNQFTTIKTIKNKTNIVFEENQKKKFRPEFQVNGFPTDSKPYNAVYNVQHRLPLYTKENKSKSWYAAGYYKVTINGKTEIMYCPKLILLQRYDYIGPVKDTDGFEFK